MKWINLSQGMEANVLPLENVDWVEEYFILTMKNSNIC